MTQATGRKIMENPGDSIGVRKSVSQDFCTRRVAASSPDTIVEVSAMEPTRCLDLLAMALMQV